MKFPDQWFQDEVRYGFYVPSLVKRCWASQIEMLEDLDRVCKAHKIQWFLAGNNLIGALQYKGYIPWDDNMVICMTREDYERLRTCLSKFPKGYALLESTAADKTCETRTLVYAQTDGAPLQSPDSLKKNHGFPLPGHIEIQLMDAHGSEAAVGRSCLAPYEVTEFPIPTGRNGVFPVHNVAPKPKMLEQQSPAYKSLECYVTGKIGKKLPFSYTFTETDVQDKGQGTTGTPEKNITALLTDMEKLHLIMSKAEKMKDTAIILQSLRGCKKAAEVVGALMKTTTATGMPEIFNKLKKYYEIASMVESVLSK